VDPSASSQYQHDPQSILHISGFGHPGTGMYPKNCCFWADPLKKPVFNPYYYYYQSFQLAITVSVTHNTNKMLNTIVGIQFIATIKQTHNALAMLQPIKTRSSAVTERPRNASCLSVVSFNIPTAQFFYYRY